MSLIQIALVLGSVLVLGLYSRFMRSTLRDRALAILFFLTAVLAILFPSLTTLVANALGVGRGTDLLVYLFVLGSAFAFTVQNARILRLEDHITKLTRELALQRAVQGGDSGAANPPADGMSSPSVEAGTDSWSDTDRSS